MDNFKKISKNFSLIYENREIFLPNELKEKINSFWKSAVKENPYLFNGTDYVVEEVEENREEIIFHVVKSEYAHYLYNERIGIEEWSYRSNTPWGGIMLITSDDYIVLGEMGETTSVPKCLQISGGGIDEKDIENGKIDIIKTIKRELKEEMNIELEDVDYNLGFFEYPTESRFAYGFLAYGFLNMKKDELEKHFNNYNQYLKENNLELEFSKLIFIERKNALEIFDKLDNPKRPYIRDFIENIMKI